MKIILTQPGTEKRAVFTWSEDMEECNFAAIAIDDEELDAMVEAGAHEGADYPGYVTEIR